MIPTAIVAHPERTDMANELAEQVRAEVVVWDSHTTGAARNHLAAWEWLADGYVHPSHFFPYCPDWSVILEDDVLPCSGFHRNLIKAIRAAPTSIVSLYLGRGRPPQYQQSIARTITADVSFITADDLISAQGYAIRTPLLAEHALVLADFVGGRQLPIDEAISAWARWRGHRISYCRHSIVDHRDGPSLILDHGDGHPRGGTTDLMAQDCDPSGAAFPEVRRAWLLANTDTDWTKGSTDLIVG